MIGKEETPVMGKVGTSLFWRNRTKLEG